jgi:CHAT domain-containing protein
MSENNDEKSKIRRYLLGELAAADEIEEIENKLLLDDAFYQSLLVEEEYLIQDYADNNLSAAERGSFETHFLISDERKQQLNFANALRKYVDEQQQQQQNEPEKEIIKVSPETGLKALFGRLFSSPAPVFAALLMIFCASLGVWYFIFQPDKTEQAQVLLDQAYRAERPFKLRVSEFSYAPFADTRGDAAADAKINLNERNQAELLLLEEANKNPNAAALLAVGRLYLVKKNYDQAIVQLEKARQLDAGNASILSDLGAARLEKAKTLMNDADGKNLLMTAQALEDFSKALEINPNLPEASFNKAVALETLNLPEQARQAWAEYLKLDEKSQWADEARKSLEAIGADPAQSKTGAEILKEFLAVSRRRDDRAAYQIISRNREMITNKLIPQQLVFSFLDAADEKEKAEYLKVLEYAGQLELEKSGDPFVADITKFYKNLPKHNFVSLQKAATRVKAGYELCATSKDEIALEEFRRARSLYAEAGNEPEARLCDYWIGYCLNRVNKIKDSTNLLLELSAFSRERTYKWLDSQANNWLVNNMLATRELTKAVRYNQEALALAEEVDDLYNRQKTLTQGVNINRYTGDYENAISFAQKSLEITAAPESSLRQKWRDYTAIADLFFAMEFYDVSFAFRKESLQIALKENNATFAFVSYNYLAATARARGKFEEAFDLLAESRRAGEKIDSAELRKRILADNDLQTAQIFRQMQNCSEAIKFYDRAVSFYSYPEYQIDLYEARKGRMLCFLETNNDESFQTELTEVLQLFREYRTKILEERNRNAFFDGEQDVYDIAIGYAGKKRDYARAFDYSEESRARSLLDLQSSLGRVSGGKAPEIKFLPETVEPFNFQQIQSEMPENVQILQYSVLPDKTLIWVITKENLNYAESHISGRDLQELSANYLKLLSGSGEAGKENLRGSAAELYRLLISPVKEQLHSEKKICLITDKSLSLMPFAALVAPAGNYFVSEFEFFAAPSASIFLLNTREAKKRKTNPVESLLSVGNPAFDKREFSELQDLPAAEREAREITRFYERALLLTNRDASKKAVEAGFEKANVVHLAGHYVVDEISPLLSGLILAGDGKTGDPQNSILANYEIIGGKMPAVKLIILSACDTGGERVYRGEGMLGAGRAFLATGVPLVIASHWKVDSDATARLMINFHYYRREKNMPATAALRRAQLDMLEDENPGFQNPYYWAAFTAFGGYAEF